MNIPKDQAYARVVAAHATAFYRQGTCAMAEAYAWEAVTSVPEVPEGHAALGVLGLAYGQDEAAWRHLAQAGDFAPAIHRLERLTSRFGSPAGALQAMQSRRVANRDRFLVAKAWGYGFWADMVHLLGAFLLAEMTGRTPVVLWGEESNYWFPEAGNIFDFFFEPVFQVQIADLQHQAPSLFPCKWTVENIGHKPTNLWRGTGSRTYAMTLFPRAEDVVVCDFIVAVNSLMRWLPSDHALFGKTAGEAFKALMKKYLRPRKHILQQVAAFQAAHLSDGPVLAVHIRNMNKVYDEPDLLAFNNAVPDKIDAWMDSFGYRTLLLITDSNSAAEQYRERYGDRLVTTDAKRPKDESYADFLFEDTSFKRQAITDVLVDSYLAASCDGFIGVGSSSVAMAVSHLKDWPPGRVHLFGNDVTTEDYFSLHESTAADRHDPLP